MADPKDTTSFFRKVVKFVANPTTEWAEVGTPSEEARENEFAKGELKAMIERKRRNDFVRKREFDMLRKVRRDGLTSEQLAALGGSSRLDDSEGRGPDRGARQQSGVKAKIDEIEQQMVGETLPSALRRNGSPPATGAATGAAGSPRAGVAQPTPPPPAPPRNTDFYNAPTEPVALDEARRRTPAPVARDSAMPATLASAAAAAAAHAQSPSRSPAAAPAAGPAGLAPLKLGSASDADFASPSANDLNEVAHDPELDEAVIAFANADFEQCEQALVALTGPGGSRARHAETWLVMFDFYRAIGQQQPFESRALDYAQQFGWSAPQWFSMPKLVAEAASEERPRHLPAGAAGSPAGWVCPEQLDPEAVARLASQAMQMPLPWVFDWSPLRSLDAESSARLSEVFRQWIGQKVDMRWLAGEHLMQLLQEMTPTGVRDVDPAFWQLRLDALRMVNRPDAFDETAIDYCVTYEVSPPSWEAARCVVRVSGPGNGASVPPMSVVSDVMTSFLDSGLADEAGGVAVGNVELSGQLVGDIGDMLKRLDAQLGSAAAINVSCAKLIRVDFIAAGDLLNWVLARRGENRSVSFIEAHRMVALFFGAMGINEHARVKVRNI